MSRTITLTFEGKNDLLLQAIEAYAEADVFSDEEGNSVRLTPQEIAMNMLMEGCFEWVIDVGGLPEKLEEEIRETFEIEDDMCCGEGESCEDESCEAEGCQDESHNHSQN